MNTIYLGGGIIGLADTECKAWREAAKELLPDWKCLDPLRRDYRGKEGTIDPALVVSDDLFDIDCSDALLVNALRPSWGTAMEIRYAYEKSKKIVAFGCNPKHFWLEFHCTQIVPGLEEAIAALKKLLGG